MKKLISSICSLLMSLVLILSFAGCNTPPQNPTQTEVSTLNIETTSKEMFVGETFDLKVFKKGADGQLQEINEISYSSDNSTIASVENGIITAKAIGETYINVTADGLDAACFITVKAGVRGEIFEIRLVEENLYKNVPVQAYVYVTVDGQLQGIVPNATFTTDSTDILSINGSGVITALEEIDSVNVKASGTYMNKPFEVQKDFAVVPPFRYLTDRSTVTLVSTKTYGGEVNSSYTSTVLEIKQTNAVTGETIIVSGDKLSVATESPLFSSEIVGNKIKFTALDGQVGSTGVYVNIEGVKEPCYFKIKVAHAIKSIADMDKLALASINNPADLSANFVLVNDIDYDGKAIYPIANYMEGKAKVGYQWKYAVGIDQNKKYVAVERENVGKDGYGLTDAEFITFAQNNGVANGNKQFTGTFDGNGYEIKNAALMYGANLFKLDSGEYRARDMAVFGSVVNGTIKNLKLTLSMQTPQIFEDEYQVVLNKIYDSSVDATNVVDCTLNVNSNSKYTINGAGLVARTDNCTVENVMLCIDYTAAVLSGSNLSATVLGGLNSKSDKINVINCVIEVNHGGTGGNVKYAISNLLSAGKIQNCLIVGVNGVTTTINANKSDYGTNGVYYRADTSWKNLYKMSIGKQASNGVSMDNVLASFKSNLWDTSKCNSTSAGYPELINGCTIPLE